MGHHGRALARIVHGYQAKWVGVPRRILPGRWFPMVLPLAPNRVRSLGRPYDMPTAVCCPLANLHRLPGTTSSSSPRLPRVEPSMTMGDDPRQVNVLVSSCGTGVRQGRKRWNNDNTGLVGAGAWSRGGGWWVWPPWRLAVPSWRRVVPPRPPRPFPRRPHLRPPSRRPGLPPCPLGVPPLRLRPRAVPAPRLPP